MMEGIKRIRRLTRTPLLERLLFTLNPLDPSIRMRRIVNETNDYQRAAFGPGGVLRP